MITTTTLAVIRGKSLAEYIAGIYPGDNLEIQSDMTWRSTCPFHDSHNPTSFAVFPDNHAYCFSCGWHGDIINYVMNRECVPFQKAVEILAENYGIDLDHDNGYIKQRDIAQKNEEACQKFERNINKVYDYLKVKRRLTDETISLYRCGYMESKKYGNALTIAMHDQYGQIVAFGYRYFDRNPKYKNSKNNELFQKGAYLFNINNAQRLVHKTKRLYIVEGHIDAMSINQEGEAAVAYCGITFTKDHVKLIRQLTERCEASVILVPDNDGRAEKMVDRGRLLFAKYYPEANVKVAKII